MSSGKQKGKMMVAKEERNRRKVHVAVRWEDVVLLRCGAHSTSYHDWVPFEDVDVDDGSVGRCVTCFETTNYGNTSYGSSNGGESE